MTVLFKRNVVVTVDSLRVSSTPEPGLRIEFKVTRSVDSTANRAECTIENLNRTSQAKCAKQNAQFSIEAGYGDSVGLIFRGKSVNGSTKKEKVGFRTTIEAADGFAPLKARVVKSLGPGTSAQQVLKTIAEKMGLELVNSPTLAGTFTTGVSLSGSAQAELDRLSRTYGFEWSIQNETLQVLLREQTTADRAVLLNKNTGLLADGPARIFDKKRPKSFIVKGRSLLQALIMPGRQLLIESGEVTGRFKCLEVDHVGCSFDGDFYSEFKARSI